MKKLITFLWFLTIACAVSAQNNLAQGKTATASSGNAALAVDGRTDGGNRWESAQTDDEWWSVDLGSAQEFDMITITWEAAYAKSFKIIASNDAGFNTYETLVEKTGITLNGFPNTQTYEFTAVSYRYVKFIGVERATQYGYSFWEFGVYKKAAPVLTTLTISAATEVCGAGNTIALTAAGKDQYGRNMDTGTVTYNSSNTAVATISGASLTGVSCGTTTITATAQGVTSNSVDVIVYEGHNIASADKVTDYNTEAADGGIANAFNGNNGGGTWVLHGNTGEAEGDRTYTTYFVMDLGKSYDLKMASLYFEGASAQEYTLQTSTNGTTWQTAATVSHTAGVNAWKDHLVLTQNNNGVRYVKFEATKAATQYGVKLFEVALYGIATGGELVKASTDAATGAAVLTGDLNDDTKSFFATDNELAYNLKAVNIASAMTITASNPNTMFIVTEAQATRLNGTKNIVTEKNGSYTAEKLDFTDGYDVNSRMAISANTATYKRSAGFSGYQTVVVPFTTTVPAGVKAYAFVGSTTGGVLFQEASSIIGGKPYLLIGANGLTLSASNAAVDFTINADNDGGNAFNATYAATTAGNVGGNVYVIDENNTFRKAAAAAQIPAFRAYMTASQALSKIDILTDGITAIDSITTNNKNDNRTYDLSGRCIPDNAPLHKGIYVRNGKKIIIR